MPVERPSATSVYDSKKRWFENFREESQIPTHEKVEVQGNTKSEVRSEPESVPEIKESSQDFDDIQNSDNLVVYKDTEKNAKTAFAALGLLLGTAVSVQSSAYIGSEFMSRLSFDSTMPGYALYLVGGLIALRISFLYIKRNLKGADLLKITDESKRIKDS